MTIKFMRVEKLALSLACWNALKLIYLTHIETTFYMTSTVLDSGDILMDKTA